MSVRLSVIGRSLRQSCLSGALIFFGIAHGSAVHAQDNACQRAFQQLEASASHQPCTGPDCLALHSIDSTIGQLDALARTSSGTQKAAFEESLAKLKEQRSALWQKLKGLNLSSADLPESTTAPAFSQAALQARLACELLTEQIKAVMAAQIGLAEKARDYAICRDKHARLPEFLKRYFALNDRDTLKGRPGVLQVLRARYGDVISEDRDFQRSTGRDRSARSARALQPATPRAGLVFTDPEDLGSPTDDALWDQHRHTCDVTWYFRRQCAPKSFTKTDATWAGNAYCLLSIAEEKAKVDEMMCGYDPSPQGIKQYHVRYACAGTTHERKFPGNTRRVHLICDPAEQVDLAAETAYFASPPCDIDIGGAKAATIAADLDKAKKAAEADKTKGGTAPTGGSAGKPKPGGTQ